MIVVQHRVNNPLDKLYTDFAEIDVYVDGNTPIVCHNLGDYKCYLEDYVETSKASKFFVDIKQNLSVEQFKRIDELAGHRVLGYFDVPYPSVYYLREYPIWYRFSEFEPQMDNSNSLWVDPLVSQTKNKMLSMLAMAHPDSRLMIASPELHGNSKKEVLDTWDGIKFFKQRNKGAGIFGLVTKFPLEAKEYFGVE